MRLEKVTGILWNRAQSLQGPSTEGGPKAGLDPSSAMEQFRLEGRQTCKLASTAPVCCVLGTSWCK